MEEHPERIEAVEQRGSLMGCEHLGRYLWASQLVANTRVLDAGCGTGYGSALLLAGNPSDLVAVDISDEAVAQAAGYLEDARAQVQLGDLRALPFADGSFDVVVCFEVIEHVAEPEVILDELRRVVAPSGFLCVSTPNRGVYPADNPHHLHEFTADEFAAALGSRFTNVALYRQAAWLATTIEPAADPRANWDEGRRVPTFTITSQEGSDTTRTPFVIALAGDGALPSADPQTVLGEPFEVTWWQEQVRTASDQQRTWLSDLERRAQLAEQQAESARRHNLESAARLLGIEAEVAAVNAKAFTYHEELEARQELIEELRAEVMEARDAAARFEQDKKHADALIASMRNSVSWRLTAPLRALKRRGIG